MKTLMERLLAKVAVDDETGCWEWTGALNSRGYSCQAVNGKSQLGHRVSYELHVGPIPAGLTIDHLCRNKKCVNPEHLEPVTVKENNRRSPANGVDKTECLRGHPYTPKNTIINGEGHRSCRECANAAKRTHSGKTSSEYWARKRALKSVPAPVMAGTVRGVLDALFPPASEAS